jgi:hypothetical protein
MAVRPPVAHLASPDRPRASPRTGTRRGSMESKVCKSHWSDGKLQCGSRTGQWPQLSLQLVIQQRFPRSNAGLTRSLSRTASLRCRCGTTCVTMSNDAPRRRDTRPRELKRRSSQPTVDLPPMMTGPLAARCPRPGRHPRSSSKSQPTCASPKGRAARQPPALLLPATAKRI